MNSTSLPSDNTTNIIIVVSTAIGIIVTLSFLLALYLFCIKKNNGRQKIDVDLEKAVTKESSDTFVHDPASKNVSSKLNFNEKKLLDSEKVAIPEDKNAEQALTSENVSAQSSFNSSDTNLGSFRLDYKIEGKTATFIAEMDNNMSARCKFNVNPSKIVSPGNFRMVALHESAHCVIAHSNNFVVESIDIEKMNEGETKFDFRNNDGCADRRELYQRIQAFMAGPVSGEVFFDNCYLGNKLDLDKIGEIFLTMLHAGLNSERGAAGSLPCNSQSSISKNDTAVEHSMEKQWAITKDMVIQSKKLIERFADVLEVEKKMTGEKARTTIERIQIELLNEEEKKNSQSEEKNNKVIEEEKQKEGSHKEI